MSPQKCLVLSFFGVLIVIGAWLAADGVVGIVSGYRETFSAAFREWANPGRTAVLGVVVGFGLCGLIWHLCG